MTTSETREDLTRRLARLDEQEARRQRLEASAMDREAQRAQIQAELADLDLAERERAGVARLDQEADAAEARARALDAEAEAQAAALADAERDLEARRQRVADLQERAASAATETERATAEGRDDDAIAARQLTAATVTQVDVVAQDLPAAEQRVEATSRRLRELRQHADEARDEARQRGWQALVDPLEGRGAPVPTRPPMFNGLLGPVACWERAAEVYRSEHRTTFIPEPAAIQAFADRHGRLLGYADAWAAWNAIYPDTAPPKAKGLRRLIPSRRTR
ncbi:MAG TPA: hypothetical protein VFW92_10445 [Candidatus Limnocylindrales bacterium]|nr:hypothetical protein [Candidatus Limnocylindrales bacterium]